MFSKDILQNDVFLDMPLTSQALYLHLNINADDDGFVSPRRVMRMIGASDDDLKILIAKRYLLSFESGVVVIKHWPISNTVRKDRYRKTTFKSELSMLTKNEFGAYTEISKITTVVAEISEVGNQMAENRQPNGNQMATQVRLGKYKYLDKSKYYSAAEKQPAPAVKTKDIDDLFALWEQEIGYAITAQVKTNRQYAGKIIKEYPAEEIKPMLKVVSLSQDDQYAPRVNNLVQLYRKWDDLKGWVRRKKASNGNRPKVAEIS